MTAVCLAAACFAAAPLGGAAPQEAAPATQQETTQESAAQAREQELETLARELRDSDSSVAARAYTRLVVLSRQWPNLEGSRAALALGYYEYQAKKYAQARAWFHQAQGDPVLSRYALYWEGVAAGAAGQNADAMALLGKFRKDFPGSVVNRPALEAYADAAIAGKAPDRAVTALRGYAGFSNSPDLLIRLAQAREQSGNLVAAALDFQRVYNRFPLDDTAKDAATGIKRLRASMGRKFPTAPLADRMARGETLYRRGRWRDARTSWAALRGSLTGIDRERATLRVAQCQSRLTGKVGTLGTLKLTDPVLDAQRWISLFEVYRTANNESRMKAAVDKVLQLSTAGAPAQMGDRALFLMGNYYWANLKRDEAVAYYQRLAARERRGSSAVEADWRIAWTAYLAKDSHAAVLLRSHIERFPNSSYVPDALYWLGRLAESDSNPSLARAYYDKASSRFAETYFGQLASQRAAGIAAKADPAASLPLLARIRSLAPVHPLENGIPTSVRGRYERATTLHSIAFDDTAVLEFRAAYRASHASQLLMDAARAAQDGKHYLTGASLVRLLAPDLESRPINSVPVAIWRIAYPLPQKSLIDSYAGQHNFDPMLYAALIRQESGFQPDIVSSAGAVGLGQLMPSTARKWSRILHLRYSYSRLTDPQYNLRVSSAYFQALIEMFDDVEAAVAAYNAGEVRVAAWVAEHHYNEPAEFVESIPFSQTRHYVKVVLSGAGIYRQLYGDRQ